MKCLDDASDAFAKEVSEISTAIIDTVKRMEEKHLGEIAKLTKESKSKLEKSVQSLEHRLKYLQHWKEKLFKNMSSETSLNKSEVLSFIKMKQIYENIRKLDHSKLEISIQSEILDSVQKMRNMSSLAKTTSRENINQYAFDTRILDLNCTEVINILEFKIENSNFTEGEFLSHDKLLLADNVNKRCVLCNTDGVVLQEIALPGSPWGMCIHGENEVLVTLPDRKKVVVLDINSLEIKQSVSFDLDCYGISTSGKTAVIGARSSVVMFDNFLHEKNHKTMVTETGFTDDVALDRDENVIYSNYSENTVKKLDKNGKILFKYIHEELTKPYGLTVDGHGNIFVNGFRSNNIHILSNVGENLRIIKGVERPQCIKFLRGTCRFFVGEDGGRVKVFELQEN